MSRRSLASLATAAAFVATAVLGGAGPAAAGTTYSAPLRTAVASLPVAAENNAGYDRAAQFGDWKDANRDCQNTRAEVLIAESKTTPKFTTARKCTVATGKWVSSWDLRTHTSASTVQIDHMVPVHEAWGSGARYWTKAKRVAFYNDLGDARSLNAQTSALNSAKQARGPEQWLPPKNQCQYIADWTAVKIRWGLKADATEKAFLVKKAASCANTTLKVTRY